MNTRLLASCLATTLALGFTSLAHAELEANLQSTFTVALKLTSTGKIKDRVVSGGHEYSADFATTRFTARDILASLIEQGSIVGPISGWSIVARSTTASALDVNRRLFAVKSGQPDHALDSSEAPLLDLDSLYAISKFRTRVINSALVADSSTLLLTVQGTFNADGDIMDLAGTGTLPYVLKPVTLGETTDLVNIPGATRLTLTGGVLLPDTGTGPAPAIVDGTIDFGAGKVTAVRVVAPAP